MKKTIKIPWDEFVAIAEVVLKQRYKTVGAPVFMKTYGTEPDAECYEIPAYVEIEIE